MLGSIIGDIIGSSYEVEEILEIKNNPKKKRSYEDRIKILDRNIPLFKENSSYTDDSVLTTAIADALINNKNYEFYLRKYGNIELTLGLDKYGRSRFGKGFIEWLKDSEQGKSYGNGSAMRIAPVAYYFDNLDDIHENAIKATIPSHNNKEAIDGALAVADTIFLARNNYSKDKIKEYIKKTYNYDLNFDLEELQKNYTFSSKCVSSVPQAIYCFLISNDFEDAIRKSISIGGDSDTIACIVGGISEAYYGIPNKIKENVQKYIPEYINNVINNFYSKLNEKDKSRILKYIKENKNAK